MRRAPTKACVQQRGETSVSINRVVISGNLTRDPEVRATQSGMNILTFGMAVNDRRRNNQTGEWEDYANFVDCVLFGNRADFLSRTLRKGTKVVVEGKLRYSSWERDGQRRSKLEVVVDDLDFVSPRQQGGYGQQPQGNFAPNQSQGYVQQGGYSQGQPQGFGQQQGTYAQGQSQSYAQQPTEPFGAPAPAPVQAPAPVAQQQAYEQPAQPVASQHSPVAPPPEDDVYDEDIPF